jgi:hypothetical protein
LTRAFPILYKKEVLKTLERSAVPTQKGISTAAQQKNGIGRFLENTGDFLNLRAKMYRYRAII